MTAANTSPPTNRWPPSSDGHSRKFPTGLSMWNRSISRPAYAASRAQKAFSISPSGTPFIVEGYSCQSTQDEESRYIKAQHEPIISEQLFDQVQQVLKGRGRDYKPKIVGNTKFPLRGFIQCPICGKTYTASTSKGRHGQYSYYHCVSPCKSRYNADAVNMAVLRELKMYIPKKEVLRLYSMTISEAFESLSENMKHEKANIKAQISEFQTKLSNARKLIVAGKIDDDDFRELKTEYVTEIERLEKALIILHADTANIDELLDQGIDNLMKLDDGIKKGELFDQRTLISAIYPENFTFDGHGVRTGRLNTVVHLIYLINKELSENKKGQIKNKF